MDEEKRKDIPDKDNVVKLLIAKFLLEFDEDVCIHGEGECTNCPYRDETSMAHCFARYLMDRMTTGRAFKRIEDKKDD